MRTVSMSTTNTIFGSEATMPATKFCASRLTFFFFQAEDGIREADVTGVQTCALPISTRYGLNATSPYQRLFVRLRGIREDSGSIYYSRHYFLVDQILEIRPTRTGECPSAAASLSSVMR